MTEEEKQRIFEKLHNAPIVKTLEELQKAEDEGYPMVRAFCKECQKTTTAAIVNARMVITKGCYPFKLSNFPIHHHFR
jgi:hypothetical protein